MGEEIVDTNHIVTITSIIIHELSLNHCCFDQHDPIFYLLTSCIKSLTQISEKHFAHHVVSSDPKTNRESYRIRQGSET